MIASLGDAWRWYESTRTLTLAMRRMSRHWDALPWTTSKLGRDEHLKHLDTASILDSSTAILADLDDLCILLLFSVFEATVRNQVLEDVDLELPSLRHAAIKHAVANMREGIEHGSFFKVIEPYKGPDAHLIKEINQVRRYRNWVAHGRRGAQPHAVDPKTAFERLQRFLDRLWPGAAQTVAE